jgi:sugar O-acyltransferase (sialic acid O-acetyltransferase NeuD family)
MKKLVIFGTGEIADVAYYYFKNDSDYEVLAFTVDEEFITSNFFNDLPIESFERLSSKFSVTEVELFIAISYQKINETRKKKYYEAKSKGYKIARYLSSRANVMIPREEIGENTFILEDNNIQPKCKIGNNVTMWSGNHLGHHSTIQDHAFITSHVVISGGVEIGEQAFIGVNATLRDHIKVGAKSIIGAGSLVMKDVPEESVIQSEWAKLSSKKSTELKNL